MELTTYFNWILLFFAYGICNIVLIIFYHYTPLNKIFVFMIALLWNFAISFWVFKIFPGSENYLASKLVKDLTGQNIKVKNVYIYDELGGFNGDGYTLYFYDLENNQKIDYETLKKFPIEEKRWNNTKWKKAPINSEDLIILEEALNVNFYNNKDSIKLKKIFNYLKTESTKNRNFYSFSEKKNKEGIELMYLSLEDKKFALINSSW